jgi:hypothetical protein
MGSILHGCSRTTPRVRAEFHGVDREYPSPCHPLLTESKDGGQVEEADHNGRHSDGNQSANQH